MLRIEFASLKDVSFIVPSREEKPENTLTVPESFSILMQPGLLTDRVATDSLLPVYAAASGYQRRLFFQRTTVSLEFLVAAGILKKPEIIRGGKVFHITPNASDETLSRVCPPDSFIVGFSTLIHAPDALHISKSRTPKKDLAMLRYKNWHWYYTLDLKKLVTALFHICKIKNSLTQLQFLNTWGKILRATVAPCNGKSMQITSFLTEEENKENSLEEEKTCVTTQRNPGLLATCISKMHTAVLINNFINFRKVHDLLSIADFDYCCGEVNDRLNRYPVFLLTDYLKKIKTKHLALLEQFVSQCKLPDITQIDYEFIKIKWAQIYIAVFRDKYMLFKKAVENLTPLEFNYACEFVKQKIQNKGVEQSSIFFNITIAKGLANLERLTSQFMLEQSMPVHLRQASKL